MDFDFNEPELGVLQLLNMLVYLVVEATAVESHSSLVEFLKLKIRIEHILICFILLSKLMKIIKRKTFLPGSIFWNGGGIYSPVGVETTDVFC